jgi:hypothetical protein
MAGKVKNQTMLLSQGREKWANVLLALVAA